MKHSQMVLAFFLELVQQYIRNAHGKKIILKVLEKKLH